MSTQLRANLDTLPNELIERIASFCSCSSALLLLQTCHVVRDALNNKHVFLDFIRMSGDGDDGMIWQPTISLSAPVEDQTIASKKWALADERARAFVADPNKSSGFTRWGPMLMVAGHPLASSCQALQIYQLMQHAVDDGYDTIPALAYSLAAQSNNDLDNGRLAEQMTSKIPPHGFDLERALSGVLRESIQRSENVETRYVHAYQALAGFSYLLRKALAENAVQYRGATPPAIDVGQPPTTSRIPFASFMSLPLPFTPALAAATRPGNSMITKGFLEDGDWQGYYSYNPTFASIGIPINRVPCRFDAPMSKIRFEVLNTDSDRARATNGMDGIGPFGLDGTIELKTGKVHLVKQYLHSQLKWDWHGVVTGFGIVGTWGREGDLRGFAGRGWFWLWKKEWCESKSKTEKSFAE